MTNYKKVKHLEDTKEGAKEHLLDNIKNGLGTVEELKTVVAAFSYIVQNTELKQNADAYLKAIKEIEECINDG